MLLYLINQTFSFDWAFNILALGLFIALGFLVDDISVVTKTLGLLLTSFIVVLMGISKTAFMFIYLVYILAFISAVLMLFLSIILMLPIVTI